MLGIKPLAMSSVMSGAFIRTSQYSVVMTEAAPSQRRALQSHQGEKNADTHP